MKDFFRKINETLRGQGRYGLDKLSCTSLVCAVVLVVLDCILGFEIFFLYAALLVAWSCIRILSKKIDKRESELDEYESVLKRHRDNVALVKRKWKDRKTYRYFRCKYCDTVFRVPKGKGKVNVTCPCCKEHFVKKT